MNRFHRFVCRSGFWKRTLERDIFPWVFEDVQLGEDVLEIGSGPGLTTGLLRLRVEKLTALELDPRLATSLAQRFASTNVTVLEQDATAMQIPDTLMDSVVCLTMLHHVLSGELQDKLFAEVVRILRPGGWFVGCDRLFRSRFDPTHLFDTKTPVLPDTLPGRLVSAGFENIQVETRRHDFRFIARKPPSVPHERSSLKIDMQHALVSP